VRQSPIVVDQRVDLAYEFPFYRKLEFTTVIEGQPSAYRVIKTVGNRIKIQFADTLYGTDVCCHERQTAIGH
jgi:hypothetical protein